MSTTASENLSVRTEAFGPTAPQMEAIGMRIPRPEDGVASQQADWPFGAGDVWILRYHGNEVDDGFNETTSVNADAKIGEWVNGDSGRMSCCGTEPTLRMTSRIRVLLSMDMLLAQTLCQ